MTMSDGKLVFYRPLFMVYRPISGLIESVLKTSTTHESLMCLIFRAFD